MGVSIALNAAKRCDPLSEPVILIERSGLGAGSSGRSGAILRQHYSDRVTAAMARDSLKYFSSFERYTGRPLGYQRTGVLTLAGPGRPQDIELLERNVEMQVSIGIDTRRVEAPEIRELVSGIQVEDGSVGAYEPGGAIVDPMKTVEAMAALARETGVVTRLGVEVCSFLIEKGAVVGVETSAGRFYAPLVVVATGPWTRGLFNGLGVEMPFRTVRPEQHFVAMPMQPGGEEGEDFGDLDDPASASGEILGRKVGDLPSGADPEARFTMERDPDPAPAHPALLDIEYGYYAKCESRNRRTRIGRMDYTADQELEDPDDLVEEVDAAFSSWARESLCARMPAYQEMPDVGAEAGWYTLTPDAQAVIGPVPGHAGCFVVSGFSGHGFKMAPAVGEGVAQMLFGEAVSAFDPEFFSLDRFLSGARPHEGRGFGL